jgi:Zn-dependent protease
LAHALVARGRGQEVGGITLVFFGAATALRRRPPEPMHDLLVAAAGPAASLGLAGAFAIALALLPIHETGPGLLLDYLARVNLVLGLLNLLPVAPLDGGRMVRAIILGLTGDLGRAEILTASVSRGGVALVGAVGVALMIRGSVLIGMVLIFLGWTLARAAMQARSPGQPQSAINLLPSRTSAGPAPACASDDESRSPLGASA